LKQATVSHSSLAQAQHFLQATYKRTKHSSLRSIRLPMLKSLFLKRAERTWRSMEPRHRFYLA